VSEQPWKALEERMVPASRETVSKLHIHAPLASTAPALSSTDPVRAVDSASANVRIQVLDIQGDELQKDVTLIIFGQCKARVAASNFST